MFSVDNVNKYTGEVIRYENLTREEAVRIKTNVEFALQGSAKGPVPELEVVTITIEPHTFIKFASGIQGIQGTWVVDERVKHNIYSIHPCGFKNMSVCIKLAITDTDDGWAFQETSLPTNR